MNSYFKRPTIVVGMLIIAGLAAMYASLHVAVEAHRARLANEVASISAAVSELVQISDPHGKELRAFLPAIQRSSAFDCMQLTSADGLILETPTRCSKSTHLASDDRTFVAHPADGLYLRLSVYRWAFYSQISHELGVYFASILLLVLVAGGSLTLVTIARNRDVIRATSATAVRYQAIVEGSIDAVLTLDKRGFCVAANDTATATFQCKEQDLVGVNINTLIRPPKVNNDTYPVVSDFMDNREKLAELGVMETVATTISGGEFPMEISVACFETDDGEFTVVFARDLSERQRSEQARMQSQRLEAIGQLTGGLAHDFNNLIGVVVGNLDLIESEMPSPDESIAKRINVARRAALRGSDITRSLLAVARRQSLEISALDLKQASHKFSTIGSQRREPGCHRCGRTSRSKRGNHS